MIKNFVYYNEFNPRAAAWIRRLIKNGDISPGEVDERSIAEVRPGDLKGYNRVHFFAGVGTWDYCLNQAGWGDREIWTASLPCQPFSAAGKGLGKSDERHLLPHYLELVKECRPAIQIGEQVPGAIKHGWLDDLYAEMEALDYAIGAVVIGAHSSGAAHIRQRIYWVADSESGRGLRRSETERGAIERQVANNLHFNFCAGGVPSGLPNTINTGSQGRLPRRQDQEREIVDGCAGSGCSDSDIEWLYCRDNKYRPIKSGIKPLVDGIARGMVYSGDSVITPNDTAEARKIRIEGYGNAIQADTATLFIKSCMEVTQ